MRVSGCIRGDQDLKLELQGLWGAKYRSWKLTLGPVQEQWLLLTTELSLQP